MAKLALAYDIGGTKIAVGIVTDQGKILKEIRKTVFLEKGPNGFLQQLTEMGQALLEVYPKTSCIGVAAAGPLDVKTGVLLDPTNLKTNGKGWGKVELIRPLSRRLKLPASLENDAAAAVLAERWVGQAKGIKNAMILTLGTGVGVGVICNGALVRSGRGLHPEGSHIQISHDDPSAPCGCGNYGCIEAYLSGRNFERRASKLYFGRTEENILSGKELTSLYKKGDSSAKTAFEEYASLMAVSINSFAVLYAPEIVVFTGSFAATFPIFKKKTIDRLKELLVRRRIGHDLLPKLCISKLDNQAGILGGAFCGFRL